MFEDRGLRRIFGPKRVEVAGEWRKLHNVPNIVRVITSRRMRWVGRVARVDERRGVYRVLMGKPEGKRTGINGRIIVRQIFRKWDVGVWTGSIWLRRTTSGGHM